MIDTKDIMDRIAETKMDLGVGYLILLIATITIMIVMIIAYTINNKKQNTKDGQEQKKDRKNTPPYPRR